MVRLAYEPHVAEAQVAQPSVDELRRRARRRSREVAGVDECNAQPGPRGVRGDRGTDDAAADDEHVEAALGERRQRALAAYTRNGFAHAFLPRDR